MLYNGVKIGVCYGSPFSPPCMMQIVNSANTDSQSLVAIPSLTSMHMRSIYEDDYSLGGNEYRRRYRKEETNEKKKKEKEKEKRNIYQ